MESLCLALGRAAKHLRGLPVTADDYNELLASVDAKGNIVYGATVSPPIVRLHAMRRGYDEWYVTKDRLVTGNRNEDNSLGALFFNADQPDLAYEEMGRGIKMTTAQVTELMLPQAAANRENQPHSARGLARI